MVLQISGGDSRNVREEGVAKDTAAAHQEWSDAFVNQNFGTLSQKSILGDDLSWQNYPASGTLQVSSSKLINKLSYSHFIKLK